MIPINTPIQFNPAYQLQQSAAVQAGSGSGDIAAQCLENVGKAPIATVSRTRIQPANASQTSPIQGFIIRLFGSPLRNEIKNLDNLIRSLKCLENPTIELTGLIKTLSEGARSLENDGSVENLLEVMNKTGLNDPPAVMLREIKFTDKGKASATGKHNLDALLRKLGGNLSQILTIKKEDFSYNLALLLAGIQDDHPNEWGMREILDDMTAKERAAFCASAAPLLAGVQDVLKRETILDAVKEIPAKDRAAVCAGAAPLIQQTMSFDERIGILNSIAFLHPTFGEGAFLLYGKKIDERHFKLGAGEAISQIAEPPSDAKVADLMTLFDAINFTDPNGVGYKDPTKLKDDGSRATKNYLRKGLLDFVSRVTNKTPFSGTPPAQKTAELNAYYAHIEKMLRHIVADLRKEGDPNVRATCLLDLAAGGRHCGGRYISETQQQYEMLKKEVRIVDLPTQLYQILHDMRMGFFEEKGAKLHGANIYNGWMKALGPQLGLIEGDAGIAQFDDPYAAKINPEQGIKEFNKTYKPVHIALRIEEAIKSSEISSAIVTDWFKEHIPSSWKKDHYDAILTKAVNSGDKWKDILAENDIFAQDGDSIETAIKNDRVGEYLSQEMRDTNTGDWKLSGILHLLTELNVLQPSN